MTYLPPPTAGDIAFATIQALGRRVTALERRRDTTTTAQSTRHEEKP